MKRQFYDLTNEPDSEDEPITHHVNDANKNNNGSLNYSDVTCKRSSDVSQENSNTQDDDDSLYAVEEPSRRGSLRASWERRNDPSSMEQAGDSSEEEIELERMLMSRDDLDSDTNASAMDMDISDDDADLYRPLGSVVNWRNMPRLSSRHPQ